MGRDGQSVIEKAGRVIDAYIDDGVDDLSFAALLERTGVSRASLHRTLAELAEHGFLTQVAQRETYRLGPRLRSVAALADSASVLALATPHLERLRDRCRETVVLAELHDGYVVPLVRVDGLHEMRMNQEVGRRYPAHAGGTGKALTAHLPDEQREALLASLELHPLTSRTQTDHQALRAALALVRRAGVAITLGERVPEAVAISSPIFDARGIVVAAVTISGVASRYARDRLVEDAVAVKRTAEAVSRELGYRADRFERPNADDLEHAGTPAREALESQCETAWTIPPADEPAV